MFRFSCESINRQLETHFYVCIYILTHTRISTRLILILKNFPLTPKEPKTHFNYVHFWCFNILIYSLEIYTLSADTAQIDFKVETSAI
jgi:hypothetical protein